MEIRLQYCQSLAHILGQGTKKSGSLLSGSANLTPGELPHFAYGHNG